MRKNKMLSLILGVIIMPVMSLGVFAQETMSKELEQLIISVKKAISIPDSYSEFSYNSTKYNDYDSNYWNLTWSEPDEDNAGRIYVTIDEDANILNYSKYKNDLEQGNIAKFTKQQAKESADKFLSKVLPKYFSQIRNIPNNLISVSDTYYFIYQQFINDIPVDFTSTTVNVSKYTNEVTSFSAKGFKDFVDFPLPENIINYQEAQKSYLDKLGISLKYHSYYDYKNKKLNTFPAYSVNNTNKAIDAKTGEIVDLYNYVNIEKEEAKLAINSSADKVDKIDKIELTPEEMESIKNISNIISKQEGENIVRQKFNDMISNDMELTYTSLNKSYINDKQYIWSLNFSYKDINISAEINANTGEINSFNYSDNEKGKNNISKEEAKNIAEKFAIDMSNDKFLQTKYNENEISKVVPIPYYNEDEPRIYSFRFIRQVNGIDFVDNFLDISIDKTTSKVIRYINRWYEEANFSDINKIISSKDAFNIINNNSKFGLVYKKTGEDKISLVYDFTNLESDYIIDPFTGDKINYQGKQYVDTNLPEYKDIKGHWCEKTVNELLQNGYYIKGNSFNPDDKITQIDFLKYMKSPIQTYSNNDDDFYKILIEDKIITAEEKDPDSYISRQDTLKFIVRFLGYDKIAKKSDIFVNPFKDNIARQYQGYASICYALGIIKADENGNFNGSNNITNAEAASIIYGMLNVK